METVLLKPPRHEHPRHPDGFHGRRMRNRYKKRLEPINLNQRRRLELYSPGPLERVIDLITI